MSDAWVPGMERGSAHAMHSMEDRKMDMGPHMRMTTLREIKPGDQEKADQVVAAARKVAEKYMDYKVALADGFKIFLPKLPQKQYHFTNYRYAFEAAIKFNPEHPTSLLYEKKGDGYKLIGVMYTAPKNCTWRRPGPADSAEHCAMACARQLCAFLRQDERGRTMWANRKIRTGGLHHHRSEDCDADGGTFYPSIFSWMVHVYPLEKDRADIWSVERQANHHMD